MGDSGYPLSLYLMKPSINPSTLAKGNYNKAHTAIGSVIERTFGILIMKFQSRYFSCCSEEVYYLYRIFFFLAQLYVADEEENNPSVPNFQNNNSQTDIHLGQLSNIRNEERKRCSFLDK